MRNLILIILVITSFTSCTKYDYFGYIKGVDYSKCGCCGGTIIEIENKQYNFYEDTKDWNIDLEKEELPLKVKVNFHKSESACTNIIVVDNLRKY